ncbi:MAG: DUF4336 domain-containing protein, partial [Pseudomonadota bacterium]
MTEDIWVIDSVPSEAARLPLPTRAALLRLKSGQLWLYAPTRLTHELTREIDALGPLAHIILPTPNHLEHVQDWAKAYPAANLWAPDGVDIGGPEPRVLQDASEEEAWREELRQLVVTGHPDHPEAVFFHRASDTLILADLISAVETAHLKPWLRPVIWLRGLDDTVGRVPRWLRRGVRDEQAFADSLERMLNWGPRRVILRHGKWYERNGVLELERAFAKVLRERQWEKA